MKRRSFLAALIAAPATAALVPVKLNIPAAHIPKRPERPVPSKLHLDVANIGPVTAGVLKSGNGSMVIDFDRGVMHIATARI